MASVIEAAYGALYEQVELRGGGDPMFLFYALNVFGLVVFWSLGGVYLALDLTASLGRYKVQPGTNHPLARADLGRVLKRCAFNQLVVNTIFTIAFGYLAIHYRGNPYKPEDIDWSLGPLLLQVATIALAEEVAFFTSHYFMHKPFLYKRFHKIHHEWTSPVAISAIYAHWVEHWLCNLTPIALGPLLCGCHVWLIFVWVGIALVQTLHAHSGYHLPFLSSPEAHDAHHKLFNVNFGPLGLLDTLCGTNIRFNNRIEKQRHFVLKSFTPVRELYPDPETHAAAAAAPTKNKSI